MLTTLRHYRGRLLIRGSQVRILPAAWQESPANTAFWPGVRRANQGAGRRGANPSANTIAAAGFALLVFAAPALGHPELAAGRALRHASHPLTVAPAACPAGVPVQAVTVVNGANVRPWALRKVENALVAQSLQLRAAWDTPCVQFGPGGWIFTLQAGVPVQNADGSVSLPIGGHHDYSGGIVSAVIQTGGTGYETWARAFTHEVNEALVDPSDSIRWRFGLLEVCDPVEGWTYQLDGVPVSDFVLPSYFNGGAGPWDQAHDLTAAFSL